MTDDINFFDDWGQKEINYDRLAEHKLVVYRKEFPTDSSIIRQQIDVLYRWVETNLDGGIKKNSCENYLELDDKNDYKSVYQSVWDRFNTQVDEILVRDELWEERNLFQQIVAHICCCIENKEDVYGYIEQLVSSFLRCSNKRKEGIRLLYNNFFSLSPLSYDDSLEKIFTIILQQRDRSIELLVNNDDPEFGAEISMFYKTMCFSHYGYSVLPSDYNDIANYAGRKSDPFDVTEQEATGGSDPYYEQPAEQFFAKPLKKFKETFNIRSISKYIFDHTQTPEEYKKIYQSSEEAIKITRSKPISLADVGCILQKKYKEEIPKTFFDYEQGGQGLSAEGAHEVAMIVLKNKNLLI